MIGARNVGVAELTRAWDKRADSSIYFDGEPSATGTHGIPRVFVPRFKKVFYEEFFGALPDVGTSGGAKWNLQDTSAAGAPAASMVDRVTGVAKFVLASTGEAETFGINFADKLQLHPAKGLVVEMGVGIDTVFTSVMRLVAGVSSAHNDTLDSAVTNAWFRLEGTGANWLAESDDGTTDNDDKGTGVAILITNIYHLRLEFVSTSDVRFWLDGTRVASGTTFKTGANAVQPELIIQKDSGTGIPAMLVDYVAAWQFI